MFKKFDSGKMNADTFIMQVEQAGVKATPEFVNYIRKNGQCQFSKITSTLNFNRDVKNNSAYAPPVMPYDSNFHRGKRVKLSGIKYHYLIS